MILVLLAVAVADMESQKPTRHEVDQDQKRYCRDEDSTREDSPALANVLDIANYDYISCEAEEYPCWVSVSDA